MDSFNEGVFDSIRAGLPSSVVWCHIQHSLKIHPEHRADTRGGEEVEGADSEEGRAGME